MQMPKSCIPMLVVVLFTCRLHAQQFALRLERITQVVMEGRNPAILRNGSADQIHRQIIAADLVGEHAEKMQRIRMMGIDL
jgi:hypothetical protein